MQSLHGHLELVCEADEQHRSYLRHQSFNAPFHLSKPYWDEKVLIVQVVNPTAGLFSGDQLRCEIQVNSGARMLFTTPSASRVHTMSTNGIASLNQCFTVQSGAWLEVFPELFIPQKDSRYRQQTGIHLASGAELFFVESLAPGRTARRETFQFSELNWDTNLYLEKKLVLRERFRLSKGDESLSPLRHPFEAAYFASCFVVTSRISPEDEVLKEIHELHSDSCWVGCSSPVPTLWAIKLLSKDSLSLRECLLKLRMLLSSKIPFLCSSPRKL